MNNKMQHTTNKKISTRNTRQSGGYAILFVVLLASIILSMTIGIAEIAFKEVSFTNTAQDSNVSFFAADTVGECAVYNLSVLHGDVITDFTSPPQTLNLTCNGFGISAPQTNPAPGLFVYDFKATGPISTHDPITGQNGCAYVNISDDSTGSIDGNKETTVTAHGFNISCNDLLSPSGQLVSDRQVERVLSYVIANN